MMNLRSLWAQRRKWHEGMAAAGHSTVNKWTATLWRQQLVWRPTQSPGSASSLLTRR